MGTLTHKDGGEIDWIMGEHGVFNRIRGGSTGQGQRFKNFAGSDHFPIYAEVTWEQKVMPVVAGRLYTDKLPNLLKSLPTSAHWLSLVAPLIAFLSLGATFLVYRRRR